MANNKESLQQQFQTIASIVKQCCDDEVAFQELSPQIVQFAKANAQNKESAKPVVDSVKQVIKDRKSDSPSKLLALKLLSRCLSEGAGEDFLIYMEKKIMSRLAIFAKHKKESNDIERGATLFGKSCHQKASADFLKLLLLYIQQWASRFPMYSMQGKQTEMAKIYQQLMKEKVTFHSEDQVLRTLGSDYNQSHDTVVSGYNPTSTAPQSHNNSAAFATGNSSMGRHQRPDLNISSMSLTQQQPHRGGATGLNSSQLDQSIRKSINASQINQATPMAAAAIDPLDQSLKISGGQQLSKEQQMQIANQIKQDYKKLSEHHSTAKLAQEVLSMQDDGQIDKDLLNSFRDQLQEGKDFSERFLKTIIETPFTIRDRDTKIEKILGIIGEIDQQIEMINVLAPKKKEEIKRSSTVTQERRKSNGLTPAGPQSSEVKGILKSSNKPQQFQTNTSQQLQQQQQQAFPDFKIDQNAFKTNFAFNPDQSINQAPSISHIPESSMFDSSYQQNQWDTNMQQQQADFNFVNPNTFLSSNQPQYLPSARATVEDDEEQKQQPPPKQSDFMDFSAFSNSNIPPIQANNGFDFGINFGQQEAPKLKAFEEIHHPQESQQNFFDWNHDANKAPSPFNVAQKSRDSTPKELVTKIEPHFPNAIHAKEDFFSSFQEPQSHKSSNPPQKRHSDINSVQMQRRRSSHNTHDKSMEREESKSVRGKILNQVPQIEQRSPDSNPIDDMDDLGQLSSSGEKEIFRVPNAINESQILRQSYREGNNVKNSPNAFEFGFNDKPDFNASMKKGKVEQATPAFEKFDFSDVQMTQRSSNRGEPDTKIPFQAAQQNQFFEDFSQTKQKNVEPLPEPIFVKKAERISTLTNKQQFDGTPKQRTPSILQDNSKQLIASLEHQISQLKNVNEGLTQDIVQAKLQHETSLTKALAEAEEYKKSAEKLEHKYNKSSRDLDQATQRLTELELLLSQAEKDLTDTRMSEGNAKKQLQQELVDARKREEEARQKAVSEEAEFKKREAYMKEQWLRDLQDKERSEEEWEGKVEAITHTVKEIKEEMKEKESVIREQEKAIKKMEEELQGKEEQQALQARQVAALQQQLASKDSIATDLSRQAQSLQDENSMLKQQLALSQQLASQQQLQIQQLQQAPPPPVKQLVFKTSKINFPKEQPQVEVKQIEVIAQPITLLEASSPKVESPINIPSPKSNNEEIKQDPFDFYDALDKSPKEVIQLPDLEVRVEETGETLNLREPSPEKPLETINDDDIPSGDSDRKGSDHSSLCAEMQRSPKEEVKEQTPEKSPFDFANLQEVESEGEEQTELKIHSQPETAEFKNEESPEKKQEPFTFQREVSPVQAEIIQPKPEERKSLPIIIPPPQFNVDELLAGIIDDKPKVKEEEKVPEPLIQVESSLSSIPSEGQPQVSHSPPKQERKSSDPFQSISPQIKPQSDSFSTAAPILQQNPLSQPLQHPPPNVMIDKNQFTTHNTETQVKLQQNLAQALSPVAQLQASLITFFRKSLQTNKAVLYEDGNIQIGVVTDYQPQTVRMRFFFGNKHVPMVQNIDFTHANKPDSHGFTLVQSRTHIPALAQSQQEPIDINFQIDTYNFQAPIYSLAYRTPSGQQQQLPIRLPLTMLKLCQAVPNMEQPQQYAHLWNNQLGAQSEQRQQFSIDFSQCRSLTQLKETLKMGRNTFVFIDGVEQQKNIVCGATFYQQKLPQGAPAPFRNLLALVKVTLTVDGHNCEIIARSSDNQIEEGRTLSRMVITNMLELIALPKFQQQLQK